ncbi:MAG: replicative DNA helicase [Cyanobacteria bacterium P01_A01_bin.114]
MSAEFNFQPAMDRLPPQNIEAEEAILGGVLLDPEAIGRVTEILVPEAFYIGAHREIYQAALELQHRGQPTDLMTIGSWLKDKGVLEKIGGQAKLAQLVDRTISAANIDQYGKLVMEKYTRRKLIQIGGDIAQFGYETDVSLEQILDQSEQKLFGITQDRPQKGLTATADILTDTFSDIEERSLGMVMPGLSCGFYDLDAMTQGFQRSDLIIAAGRPAMGKTSFVLNVARSIAGGHKQPVAVFSLEMSKQQLVYRLLSSEAQIESGRLRTGRIAQHEWEPLGHAISSLSQLPIFIDDTPNIAVTEMRSKCRRLQAENGGALGLILIDYLQLMEGTSDNRVQELSKITRSLKGLARELNVPIISLSQLSRGVESRTNKRPMMSDLRESGCLSGDTLITLAQSGRQVPISQLVGQTGFEVWALNENTYKLERATATKAFSTGIKPIFKLTTRLGRTIRATGNHPFRTFEGWQRLDALTPGDRLALPRTLANNYPQTLTDSELGLLGHLIGDGCTLPRHAIQYTTREFDLAQRVVDLATDIFGAQLTPRIVKERQWYQVYLSASQRLTHGVRNPVAQWLDKLGIFGLRSHEKHVPQRVFEQSAPAIATFLRHLWSTDGSLKLIRGKRSRPIAYYASSSSRLARDVQSLLLRLGINGRLKKINQGRKGRPQYHVVVTGKGDLDIFIATIGAVGDYKLQALADIQSHLAQRVANTNRDVIPMTAWRLYALPAMQAVGLSQRQMQAALEMSYCGTTLHKHNLSRARAQRVADVVQSAELAKLASSDLYWDEIISIEPDGVEEVFDLTVPGPHNFVANNILVHNSIEQDADLIMMLYREEYYDPDTPDRGIAEVIIAKHRNGPTGTIKLLFEPQFTRFRNLAKPSQ